MLNKEVQAANVQQQIRTQIRELCKSIEGLKRAYIEAALAISSLFEKSVQGTKKNPIKFSKRYRRK